ncbi:MAG: hypothetical protein EOO05_02395 [Chitinophagaceae bacterium]|nr:MAG: hypothetical protein EOO05_02395 [Chitinophagaceae bacterium]
MKNILRNYQVQVQLLDNWCWAAVTSSVSRYYNSRSRWTQNNLAASLIDEQCANDGNNTGFPPQCDTVFDVATALRMTRNYAPGVNRPLSLAAIKQQIDRQWPVCCQIQWQQLEGSHFVVIYGYENDWLRIGDPSRNAGAIDIPYNELVSGYRDDGEWVRSIGTTPAL